MASDPELTRAIQELNANFSGLTSLLVGARGRGDGAGGGGSGGGVGAGGVLAGGAALAALNPIAGAGKAGASLASSLGLGVLGTGLLAAGGAAVAGLGVGAGLLATKQVADVGFRSLTNIARFGDPGFASATLGVAAGLPIFGDIIKKTTDPFTRARDKTVGLFEASSRAGKVPTDEEFRGSHKEILRREQSAQELFDRADRLSVGAQSETAPQLKATLDLTEGIQKLVNKLENLIQAVTGFSFNIG